MIAYGRKQSLKNIKRDNSDERQRALASEGEPISLIINRLYQLLIRVSLVRAQLEEPNTKKAITLL
jgi:hypothetical protein